MDFVDKKLEELKTEAAMLAERCNEIGDHKTQQLMLEVVEMLEVTHHTFLGNALKTISSSLIGEKQKH